MGTAGQPQPTLKRNHRRIFLRPPSAFLVPRYGSLLTRPHMQLEETLSKKKKAFLIKHFHHVGQTEQHVSVHKDTRAHIKERRALTCCTNYKIQEAETLKIMLMIFL